ncbi:MAG: hypothetical protein HUU30_12010 [Burkholderiaceae bacterium]|nr:hypothetical protein [Aquabacterium sp.]MCK6434855.1 hypothetical protein [Aquabacterium sp.]NUP86460.1 hypothetical protein [Burkholderiaceae bacterium]
MNPHNPRSRFARTTGTTLLLLPIGLTLASDGRAANDWEVSVGGIVNAY